MKNKFCKTCGKTKSVSHFGKNRSKHDGLQTQCKKCRVDYQRDYYKKNRKDPDRKRKRDKVKTIRCTGCNTVKDKSEFSKHPNTITGRRHKCRYCVSKERFKYKYGVDLQHKLDLLSSQNGKCAICGREGLTIEKWHQDHCHETERVRGVLCGRRNAGLGMFGDSVDSLASAIKYLCKWKDEPI